VINDVPAEVCEVKRRWTSGLPDATRRVGAMMAHRGLSVSQPWKRADTHAGPELKLHIKAEYIDAALTLVSLRTSSCDARPDHTSWHIADLRPVAISPRQSAGGRALTGRTALPGMRAGAARNARQRQDGGPNCGGPAGPAKLRHGCKVRGSWPSAGPILTISQPYLSHVEVSP
jgi:hypothetical protein